MPLVISSTTMAPLGFARNWIKHKLRSHKNSSPSSRNSGASDPAKTRCSFSSASSSSWLPSSSSPETFSLIASTPSVTYSSAPPIQTQPGTRIKSSVARSTVALQASTSPPASFLQPSHLSLVSSLLSPQSQLHLPVAHCSPPPPARSSSIPLQQPVRATTARSAKKSLSSATSKDAILTTYRRAAASRSAPLIKTATHLPTERQYKHTVIDSPHLLPLPRPPTPSHSQPLVPKHRNNVLGHTDGPSFKSDSHTPSLSPPLPATPWPLHDQLKGSQQSNRSFASLPTQLLSSSPFSFLWSTTQQLEQRLGSNRTRSTSHPSNPPSCSSSFSRQHHQRNPSPIHRSEHYLHNSHRNQPPFLATSSLMSTSHHTAAPPPPLQQKQSHFHPSQRQQQNKIYSCQPTNMFRSLSSRFGASTETLPAVETVVGDRRCHKWSFVAKSLK